MTTSMTSIVTGTLNRRSGSLMLAFLLVLGFDLRRRAGGLAQPPRRGGAARPNTGPAAR